MMDLRASLCSTGLEGGFINLAGYLHFVVGNTLHVTKMADDGFNYAQQSGVGCHRVSKAAVAQLGSSRTLRMRR